MDRSDRQEHEDGSRRKTDSGTLLARLKEHGRRLRREGRALSYAVRDPRVPWYGRVLILLTVAYIVSPLDLIPDFIPVLGLLDDLVIVPLGIYLSFKTIPKEVLEECRKRAEEPIASPRMRRYGALLVVAVWVVTLAILAAIVFHHR